MIEVVLHGIEDEPLVLNLPSGCIPRVGDGLSWMPQDVGYQQVTEVGWLLAQGGVQLVHVTVEKGE